MSSDDPLASWSPDHGVRQRRHAVALDRAGQGGWTVVSMRNDFKVVFGR